MLATSAKTALRGSLNAAKRAVPHLIAHKVVSTIADTAKKRKRVDINVKHSQDGSGIVLDYDDWGIYTRTSRNQCY